MLEWRWRAKVSEERVSRLQELEIQRDGNARKKIDKLEEKIKNLSRELQTQKKKVNEGRNPDENHRYLEGSSSVGDEKAFDEGENSDGEWIVIRIPKRDKTKFRADFMDKGVGDGKEWLDGPCDLNTSIQELLNMCDEGRAVRKSKAEKRMRNEGRRRVRFGSNLRKPTPPMESLRRSIAPGSYDSWSNRDQRKLEGRLNQQLNEQGVDRDSSNKSMTDDKGIVALMHRINSGLS